MSLLNSCKVPFKNVVVTETDDGEGSRNTVYSDGQSTYMLAVVEKSCTPVEVAGHTELSVKYTLTGARSYSISPFSIIKRASDGKMFRILSNGMNVVTPSLAAIDIQQWDAEEFNV